MSELNAWGGFYEIVGSAAGALIGLQFVVLTLIAQRPPTSGTQLGAAFATPTIIHFGTALLLSAMLTAPWQTITAPALLCEIIGIAGTVYAAIVARRVRRQTVYRPVFEDWLFHAALPLLAYVVLALSAFFAPIHTRRGLFGIGGAALLLLFVGIHNAWDSIAYQVFTIGANSNREEH